MLRTLLGKIAASSVIGGAVAQLTSVVRNEIDITKREVQRKIKGIAAGIGLLLIGGAFLMLVVGLLVFAAVVALSNVWPSWLAALVIAALLAIIGIVIVSMGSSKIKANSDLRPERAVNAYRRFTGGSL